MILLGLSVVVLKYYELATYDLYSKSLIAVIRKIWSEKYGNGFDINTTGYHGDY